MAMTPILANAIDLPLVFLLGLAVLAPLMAIQVFVEATAAATKASGPKR
jgi:hypothetical protein